LSTFDEASIETVNVRFANEMLGGLKKGPRYLLKSGFGLQYYWARSHAKMQMLFQQA